MRLVFPLAFLVACGGTGSGLPKDTTLADLDEGQWEQLCEWTVDSFPASTECDDGTSVEGGTVDECVVASMKFYGTCDASVEEYEECMNAIAEDPCSTDLPSECGWAIACAFSSM